MPEKLLKVNARLFASDVKKLKQIAAKKLVPWQLELRLHLHRTLDVAMVDPNRKGPNDPR